MLPTVHPQTKYLSYIKQALQTAAEQLKHLESEAILDPQLLAELSQAKQPDGRYSDLNQGAPLVRNIKAIHNFLLDLDELFDSVIQPILERLINSTPEEQADLLLVLDAIFNPEKDMLFDERLNLLALNGSSLLTKAGVLGAKVTWNTLSNPNVRNALRHLITQDGLQIWNTLQDMQALSGLINRPAITQGVQNVTTHFVAVLPALQNLLNDPLANISQLPELTSADPSMSELDATIANQIAQAENAGQSENLIKLRACSEHIKTLRAHLTTFMGWTYRSDPDGFRWLKDIVEMVAHAAQIMSLLQKLELGHLSLQELADPEFRTTLSKILSDMEPLLIQAAVMLDHIESSSGLKQGLLRDKLAGVTEHYKTYVAQFSVATDLDKEATAREIDFRIEKAVFFSKEEVLNAKAKNWQDLESFLQKIPAQDLSPEFAKQLQKLIERKINIKELDLYIEQHEKAISDLSELNDDQASVPLKRKIEIEFTGLKLIKQAATSGANPRAIEAEKIQQKNHLEKLEKLAAEIKPTVRHPDSIKGLCELSKFKIQIKKAQIEKTQAEMGSLSSAEIREIRQKIETRKQLQKTRGETIQENLSEIGSILSATLENPEMQELSHEQAKAILRLLSPIKGQEFSNEEIQSIQGVFKKEKAPQSMLSVSYWVPKETLAQKLQARWNSLQAEQQKLAENLSDLIASIEVKHGIRPEKIDARLDHLQAELGRLQAEEATLKIEGEHLQEQLKAVEQEVPAPVQIEAVQASVQQAPWKTRLESIELKLKEKEKIISVYEKIATYQKAGSNLDEWYRTLSQDKKAKEKLELELNKAKEDLIGAQSQLAPEIRAQVQENISLAAIPVKLASLRAEKSLLEEQREKLNHPGAQVPAKKDEPASPYEDALKQVQKAQIDLLAWAKDHLDLEGLAGVRTFAELRSLLKSRVTDTDLILLKSLHEACELLASVERAIPKSKSFLEYSSTISELAEIRQHYERVRQLTAQVQWSMQTAGAFQFLPSLKTINEAASVSFNNFLSLTGTQWDSENVAGSVVNVALNSADSLAQLPLNTQSWEKIAADLKSRYNELASNSPLRPVVEDLLGRLMLVAETDSKQYTHFQASKASEDTVGLLKFISGLVKDRSDVESVNYISGLLGALNDKDELFFLLGPVLNKVDDSVREALFSAEYLGQVYGFKKDAIDAMTAPLLEQYDSVRKIMISIDIQGSTDLVWHQERLDFWQNKKKHLESSLEKIAEKTSLDRALKSIQQLIPKSNLPGSVFLISPQTLHQIKSQLIESKDPGCEELIHSIQAEIEKAYDLPEKRSQVKGLEAEIKEANQQLTQLKSSKKTEPDFQTVLSLVNDTNAVDLELMVPAQALAILRKSLGLNFSTLTMKDVQNIQSATGLELAFIRKQMDKQATFNNFIKEEIQKIENLTPRKASEMKAVLKNFSPEQQKAWLALNSDAVRQMHQEHQAQLEQSIAQLSENLSAKEKEQAKLRKEINVIENEIKNLGQGGPSDKSRTKVELSIPVSIAQKAEASVEATRRFRTHESAVVERNIKQIKQQIAEEERSARAMGQAIIESLSEAGIENKRLMQLMNEAPHGDEQSTLAKIYREYGYAQKMILAENSADPTRNKALVHMDILMEIEVSQYDKRNPRHNRLKAFHNGRRQHPEKQNQKDFDFLKFAATPPGLGVKVWMFIYAFLARQLGPAEKAAPTLFSGSWLNKFLSLTLSLFPFHEAWIAENKINQLASKTLEKIAQENQDPEINRLKLDIQSKEKELSSLQVDLKGLQESRDHSKTDEKSFYEDKIKATTAKIHTCQADIKQCSDVLNVKIKILALNKEKANLDPKFEKGRKLEIENKINRLEDMLAKAPPSHGLLHQNLHKKSKEEDATPISKPIARPKAAEAEDVNVNQKRKLHP